MMSYKKIYMHFKFEQNLYIIVSSIIFNLILYFAHYQNINLILNINNTYYTPFNSIY